MPRKKCASVLERVQTNGKHLLGLINDVLDLSKIEAGQLALSLSDYSIKEWCRASYARSSRWRAQEARFRVEVPPDLPPARGDDRRLTQVLLNLVGNAIKFTDAGEVSDQGRGGERRLHDCGPRHRPGIAEADQSKIFEEFQQADNSQTKAKGGTGLGLAIARRIVEMHGGGSGSSRSRATARRFRSRCRSAWNSRRSQHEQAHSRGRGPGGQSADPARLLQRRLDIVEAVDGEPAVAAAKPAPDLILMDIQLPLSMATRRRGASRPIPNERHSDHRGDFVRVERRRRQGPRRRLRRLRHQTLQSAVIVSEDQGIFAVTTFLVVAIAQQSSSEAILECVCGGCMP